MSEPVGFPPPTPPYIPATNLPAANSPSPTYAPPRGYAPPPQGYGPWTAQPAAEASGRGDARSAGGAGIGLVAFLLALLATVGAPIAAALSGFRIGLEAGGGISAMSSPDIDWAFLTPAREWVLLGEIGFWSGTALGIWAIVQGSIAIAKNRGRGWGIAGVVIAVLGPFLFGLALWMFALAGLASGASAG